jgi:hypothetical protein
MHQQQGTILESFDSLGEVGPYVFYVILGEGGFDCLGQILLRMHMMNLLCLW